MAKKRIIVNRRDYVKLMQILQRPGRYFGDHNLKNLEAELTGALLLEPEKIPADVITMNTRVRFIDMNESDEFDYTIVYPADADIEQGRLSVLAPIGTALLGYRVGDVVSWRVPAGMKKFRIEEILYQPEADGNYLL